MEKFLEDHWVAISCGIGIAFTSVCASITWMAKLFRDGLIHIGSRWVTPLIDGHLSFMQKTVQEQEMQSDSLTSISEDGKKLNERMESLISELQAFKSMLGKVSCQYEAKVAEDVNAVSPHPSPRKAKGG